MEAPLEQLPEDGAPKEADFTVMGLDELLTHANWKARKVGYEKLLSVRADGVSALKKCFKAVLAESNAAAQEALLDALVEFVRANEFTETEQCDAIVAFTVERGITGRPKAVTTSNDLLSCAVARGRGAAVMEALIANFTAKNPKLRNASVQSAALLIGDFGIACFPVKAVVRSIAPLFADTNPLVRKEASKLCCQCYRYAGDSIMSFLSDLREGQIQELTAQFKTVERCECAPKQVGSTTTASKADSAGPRAAACANPLADAMDEAEVLSKLPKDFFEKVLDKAAKWQARLELVNTALLPLIGVARITKNASYTELTKAIRELIMEAQMPLTLVGIKCVQLMAGCLRSDFAPYVRHILPPLFEKFREKKTSLLDLLDVTLTTLFKHGCLTMDACQEEIAACMTSKIPNQRLATLHWVNKMIVRALSKEVPPFTPAKLCAASSMFHALVGDEKCEVRDTTLILMRNLSKLCGEHALQEVLSHLDKKQLAKVKSETTPTPSPAASPREPPEATSTAPPAEATPTEPKAEPKAEPRKVAKKPDEKKAACETAPAATAVAVAAPVDEEGALCPRDAAISALRADISPECIEKLAAKEWRIRVEGAQEIAAAVAKWDAQKSNALVEPIVAILQETPGWKESVCQVVVAMVGLFNDIFSKATNARVACAVTRGITPKLADAKAKGCVCDCFCVLAESCGPKPIVRAVINTVTTLKNPKVALEATEWMDECLAEFPTMPVDGKTIVEYVKGYCFEQPTQPIRQAGIRLLLRLRQRMGSKLDAFLSDINAHVRKSFEEEVAKNVALSEPKVLRHVRTEKPAVQSKVASLDSQALTAAVPPSSAKASPQEIEDFPRIDVSARLAPQTREISGNVDWKERLAAIKKAGEILVEAHKHVTPSGISELLKALQLRLNESNKNTVTDVLRVMSLAIESAGPHVCRGFLKNVLPLLFPLLGDQKPQLRDECIRLCETGAMSLGLEAILLQLTKAMATDNALGRQAVVEIALKLIEQQETELAPKTLLPMVAPLVKFLLDRTSEIRAKAERVLLYVSRNVGLEAIQRTMMDMRPAEQQQLRGAYDRIQQQLASEAPVAHPTVSPQKEPREKALAATATLPPKAKATTGDNTPTKNTAACSVTPPPATALPASNDEPKAAAPDKFVRCDPTTKMATHSPLPPKDEPRDAAMPSLLTLEEIVVGLKSASAPGAVRMCRDFKAHFQSDNTISCDRVVRALFDRLHDTCKLPAHFDPQLAEALLLSLQLVFSRRETASQCDVKSMFHYLSVILDSLLSDGASAADSDLVRAMNTLALNFIENCNPDHVFETLMNCLGYYSAAYLDVPSKLNHKYVELVVKCLLRHDLKRVNLDILLVSIHTYLSSNPPSYFRDRDDITIRTVKTLLKQAAQIHGGNILDRCSQLVGANTLILTYVTLSLKHRSVDPNAPLPPQSNLPSSETAAVEPVGTCSAGKDSDADPHHSLSNVTPNVIAQPPSTSTDDSCVQMFGKIRKYVNADAGMQELYEYLKNKPGNTTEFLANFNRCSDAFRRYIRRKLEQKYEEDNNRPAGFVLPVWESQDEATAAI